MLKSEGVLNCNIEEAYVLLMEDELAIYKYDGDTEKSCLYELLNGER